METQHGIHFMVELLLNKKPWVLGAGRTQFAYINLDLTLIIFFSRCDPKGKPHGK